MAEEGGAAAPVPAAVDHVDAHHTEPAPIINRSRTSTWSNSPDFHASGAHTPMTLQGLSLLEPGLDAYFVGPRNMDAHSKLPYFLRLQGSVTPRMILPLLMIGSWATLITCISKLTSHKLAVNTLLLTVLGFVVGLALSFRSTTAYERYSDGRKAWATLSVQSRNLARYIWIHIDERPESVSQDLLSKVTAVNLILAFAVSLKHKLRFEPYAHYPDISSLIAHLDTFAMSAHGENNAEQKKKSPWKATGEFLGLSCAISNPRKAMKRATAPLGNLPLEILNYLSCYVSETTTNGTLASPVILGQIMTSLASLTDTMSSAERVLTTPLPVGYNILISQIVLLYVYLLPFQLISALDWVTIPGTIAAAYIILGLAAIGNELENPFGNDVNDLPLDSYCEELRRELDFLVAVPMSKTTFGDAVKNEGNKPLWPLSQGSAGSWSTRSETDIRAALKAKVVVGQRVGTSAGDSGRMGSAGKASSGGSTKIEP